jgi:outer membrane protein OmpA-like peptidoglycan-associated protein
VGPVLDSRRRRLGERASPGQAITLGVTDLMTSLAIIFVLLLVVFVNAARSAHTAREWPPSVETHLTIENPVAPEPGLTVGKPLAAEQHLMAELPPAAEQRPMAELPLAAEPRADVPRLPIPIEQVRAALQRSSPSRLALETDPADPQALQVVIPESLLTFEFGKSRLAPAADRFLAELVPSYARALCGALRQHIAGIVIEGHTDDVGGDEFNLRLSQERSFRVLVRGLEAVRASAPSVHPCFLELASASGRGKQDLVVDDQGRPNRERSRRVIFKILLRPVANPA